MRNCLLQSPGSRSPGWTHVDESKLRRNEPEVDGDCEGKIEEGRAKVPEAEDPLRATESKVLHSASKQGSESEPIIVESSPVVGHEISAQELSSNRLVEGKIDENKHETPEAENAETKVMKAANIKEERTIEDSKSSFHRSQCKGPDLSISGLSGKYKDKSGDSQGPAGSAKFPCYTPRSQSAAGFTRTSKDGRSSSKISSQANLSRVRKGNKSAKKFEGEQAPTVHEDQEAADYIKEFKARSIETEKDQARPSVNNVGELVDEEAVLPAIANTEEGCTTEARKKSPRKESNHWLSNILEKFPGWKCGVSDKEFSCQRERTNQEEVDGFHSCEQADRLYGLETVGRVHTPRTKHNEEFSQEVPATRKNVPFRLGTLGSLNTLRDIDWYCEEQTGWSDARTKVDFTMEELEALKLELYGTLTGETITSHQKKVILGKEKVKRGPRVEPKPQGLNPLLFPHQSKDPVQKTRPDAEEKDQISRFQIREEKLEHRRSPTPKPDTMKSVTRQENETSKEDKNPQEEKSSVVCPQECIFVQESQSTDERHDLQHKVPNEGEQNQDKKPPTKDHATQYNFAKFGCMSNQEQIFSKDSAEKQEDDVKTSLEVPRVSRLQHEADYNDCRVSSNKVNMSVSTFVNQHDAFASSESNLEIRKGETLNELASAREVAEELIRAWRAGQIGGDIRTTFQRAKPNRTQVSRKRRAATVEDGHAQVSTSYPETTQKLGQLREKINRPQQYSATKLRKWDVLTPPHGSVSQGKRESSIVSASKSGDTSKSPTTFRKVQSSPKASNQHCKCSPVPGKKFPEEMIDKRVEDVVPEARSLDFILCSLSAQVRELDERLQNVTACSIGLTDTPPFICTPGEHGEYETVADASKAATYVPSADGVSQIPGRSCSGLQRCSGGDTERVKTPSAFSRERERIRARKDLPAPPKSPLVSRKTNGSISSLQKCQDESKVSNSQITETRLSGFSPSSVQQVQSPISSMGICLEDMAELMQEMNGSLACQKMRAHLLEDSFLDNLPRRRQSGPVDVEQEDIEPRPSGEKFRNLDTLSVTISQQSGQERRGRASNFSFETFADICSRKVEPAILDGLGTSDAEKQMPDGMTVSPTHAVSRSPSRQPGRISRSSLDLEDAMRLDGNEEHMLLSSSVDFSPWNTANVPDVFTSITDVGKGLNYITPLGPTRGSKDGGAKFQHCHLKESSKYLLRNNEFKKKYRSFERKRLGQGKGKSKKSPRKPFNPLALPPKRFLSPRSSTRSLQATPQPRALKFSRRDVKLTKDSRSKSKLTSRSLPEDYQMSVTAEEVQKWLCRDPTSSLARPPNEIHGRRRSVVKYPQSPGTKKPGGLATAAQSPSHQQERTSPPLVITTPEVDRREPIDRRSLIKRDLEARRRPSSAGVVLSRR